MRIRTIKPEWLDDERIVCASPEARVLTIALILLADDHGRGRASSTVLAGRVFPASENPRETLAKALEELARLSFVLLYEVGGQSYFAIRNWARHQKVDRPSRSQLPPPPEESGAIPDTSRTLENPREDSRALASPRETLATDQDQDQDQDQDPPRACAHEGGLDPEAVRSAYLARWEANPATRGKRPPLVARGPGAPVWLELAREAGDSTTLARLLAAAFEDSFVSDAGWTPGAIRGAAARLIASGPKRPRGVARARTHEEITAEVAEKGESWDGF